MIEIKVESFTNGFSVSVFDRTDGYIVREIVETKAEALGVLIRVLMGMADAERKRIEGAYGA